MSGIKRDIGSIVEYEPRLHRRRRSKTLIISASISAIFYAIHLALSAGSIVILFVVGYAEGRTDSFSLVLLSMAKLTLMPAILVPRSVWDPGRGAFRGSVVMGRMKGKKGVMAKKGVISQND